jgi:HEPN domain-containing protein
LRVGGAIEVNREYLQRLAQERIGDAKALLAVQRWPGAYYLAGYAVECALKSCVLAHIEKTGAIFSKRAYLKSLSDSWTHDLETLIGLAGLTKELGLAHQASLSLKTNWGIAKDWNETSRYDYKTKDEAEALFEAINQEPDGVLQWLRTYW